MDLQALIGNIQIAFNFEALNQVFLILNILDTSSLVLGADTGLSDKVGSHIGAGLAVMTGIGAGAGQGSSAGRGALASARNPEAINQIRTTLFIAMAIAESSAIYGVFIAILLLFVV